MRRMVLAAALGLSVGAAGRAEAGLIITYTYTTDPANHLPMVTGSFQVDADHIGPSGTTDITSFITNASFTFVRLDGSTSTFNSPPPNSVTVTPAGDFAHGSRDGVFIGFDTTGHFQVLVLAIGMTAQSGSVRNVDVDEFVFNGEGHWTHTPLPGADVLAPEPATLAPAVAGALALAGYARRRRVVARNAAGTPSKSRPD
jgi:hypothetical protein